MKELRWLLERGFTPGLGVLSIVFARMSYGHDYRSQWINGIEVVKLLIADGSLASVSFSHPANHKRVVLGIERNYVGKYTTAQRLAETMRIPQPHSREGLLTILAASPATREFWRVPMVDL
jgi:hypothetical protein